MARTLMTVLALPQPFATAGAVVPLLAQSLDNVNGNYFPSTGREVLVLFSSAGAQTATITAQPDAEGRSQNLAVAAMGAGAYVITQMFPTLGWSIGGYINVDVSATGVNYALFQVTLSRWPVI